MTYNSTTTTDTDEIEFTAAYGTAVAIMGTRQRDIRSHQQEAVGETSGDDASRGNIATANDQHWAGLNTSSIKTKRSARSTHARASGSVSQPRPKQGTSEVTGRRPANDDSLQPRSDMKRRRKSA